MKLYVPILFLLATLSTGCASWFGGSSSTTTTPTDISVVIADHETEIRLVSALSTNVALLNVPQQSRVQTARYVYEVASSVNTAVSGGNVDLTQINALAQSLLKKLDNNSQLIAGSLLDTVEMYLESELNQYASNFVQADKNKAIVIFVQAMTSGMEQTSLLYTQGTPNATLTAMAYSPNVVVKPLLWPSVTPIKH
jgi:hypothetical protein